MKTFLILLLSLGFSESRFPFPIISNKTLFVIDDIGLNQTFQLFFSKPTEVVNQDVYVYDNINHQKFLTTWQADYYIIETGLLFETRFIKEEEKKPLQIMNVRFLHSLLLRNSSLPKHVYVDPGVKMTYKIWITNQTSFNGEKYISDPFESHPKRLTRRNERFVYFPV